MKLQLDFDEKTVSIERDVDAGELVKAMKNLLPDWKEWKIKAQSLYLQELLPIYLAY